MAEYTEEEFEKYKELTDLTSPEEILLVSGKKRKEIINSVIKAIYNNSLVLGNLIEKLSEQRKSADWLLDYVIGLPTGKDPKLADRIKMVKRDISLPIKAAVRLSYDSVENPLPEDPKKKKKKKEEVFVLHFKEKPLGVKTLSEEERVWIRDINAEAALQDVIFEAFKWFAKKEDPEDVLLNEYRKEAAELADELLVEAANNNSVDVVEIRIEAEKSNDQI